MRTRNVAVGSLPPWPGARQCAPDVLATTLAKRPTMCASNPYPRELPKTQTTSAKMGESGVLCSRWSVFWAPRPLELWLRRRQTGGIALHEGPTRRRHAAEGRHVVQNPYRSQPEVRRIDYKSGAQHRLARKSSPGTAPLAALPRKSSPSTHKKCRIWAILSAQGEFFRAFTIYQRRRENFFARADVGPPVHYPSATGPHWCGGHRRTRRAQPQCP